MKIAIVGSPKYRDETKLFPIMAAFLEDQTHSNVIILTGNMMGTEKSAERFAHNRGLDCVVFRPSKPVDRSIVDLTKNVYERNKQIVDNADKVLAFWDGESPIVQHIIKYAKAREVPHMIIYPV